MGVEVDLGTSHGAGQFLDVVRRAALRQLVGEILGVVVGQSHGGGERRMVLKKASRFGCKTALPGLCRDGGARLAGADEVAVGVVVEVGHEPFLGFFNTHPLALRVALELIAFDFSDGEIF